MILSDIDVRKEIARKRILIDPMPEDSAFQPSSVDLRLANRFGVFREYSHAIGWDDDMKNDITEIELPPGESFWLEPGQFILGYTMERIVLPRDIEGEMVGKSKHGRRGIAIEFAGLFDPGWDGQGVMEIKSLQQYRTIELRPGGWICQMKFTRLSQPASRAYGDPRLRSHYQGQVGVVAARGER